MTTEPHNTLKITIECDLKDLFALMAMSEKSTTRDDTGGFTDSENRSRAVNPVTEKELRVKPGGERKRLSEEW